MEGSFEMSARVLVVDDESAIREAIRTTLEYEGYEVDESRSGQEALEMLGREAWDVILLDIKMPAMDGLEVLENLRSRKNRTPVVMISGHADIQTAVEATRLGAYDFLEKPLNRDRLLLSVRNAVKQRLLEDENTRLRMDDESRFRIVGESASIVELRELIDRAAPTKATVLIAGESGTGKELVARDIHTKSPRADKAFVQVNCAAIPDELIESELFGHEKGSFTGAVRRQVGKFVAADGGTIFLDEIGDMSLKTQAKVLRVLQEGHVEPVGAASVITVDVRVIAATNKNLAEEIKQGRFREDLYYRLNVIPIRTPPLRERRDDIVLLAQHFALEFAGENNYRTKSFTEGALGALKDARWRGNVRELRNMVERLVVMTPSDEIDLKDLPAEIFHDGHEITEGIMRFSTLQEFKDSSEKAFILAKLRENGWNVSRTAEAIATPRSNLYKKIEQYDIKREGGAGVVENGD
jgi:two-component system, NtrC family, nitrogen regulation response regulator NtrX